MWTHVFPSANSKILDQRVITPHWEPTCAHLQITKPWICLQITTHLRTHVFPSPNSRTMDTAANDVSFRTHVLPFANSKTLDQHANNSSLRIHVVPSANSKILDKPANNALLRTHLFPSASSKTLDQPANNSLRITCSHLQITKKGKRKVQGEPQSQTAALSRHQENPRFSVQMTPHWEATPSCPQTAKPWINLWMLLESPRFSAYKEQNTSLRMSPTENPSFAICNQQNLGSTCE